MAFLLKLLGLGLSVRREADSLEVRLSTRADMALLGATCSLFVVIPAALGDLTFFLLFVLTVLGPVWLLLALVSREVTCLVDCGREKVTVRRKRLFRDEVAEWPLLRLRDAKFWIEEINTGDGDVSGQVALNLTSGDSVWLDSVGTNLAAGERAVQAINAFIQERLARRR